MTKHDDAIAAAEKRMQEAAEKFDRQQRRYALLTVPSDPGERIDKTAQGEQAKALLKELEAEFEAAQDALRALREASPPR